jgi:nicotinate-nucleotide adenylyltransferase
MVFSAKAIGNESQRECGLAGQTVSAMLRPRQQTVSMTKKSSRIGILGGTFNPVHVGHLLMARDALEQAHLDAVELIPCQIPSHKGGTGLVSGRHRLRMLQRAVRGMDGLRVNDIDLQRDGLTYSVDTLSLLRRERPFDEFFFIIGSDSLPDLTRWRCFERLKEMCAFIVVARPGTPVRPSRRVPVEAVVKGHMVDISSTDIRKRIARGQGIHYLVPDAVRRYIERELLYR